MLSLSQALPALVATLGTVMLAALWVRSLITKRRARIFAYARDDRLVGVVDALLVLAPLGGTVAALIAPIPDFARVALPALAVIPTHILLQIVVRRGPRQRRGKRVASLVPRPKGSAGHVDRFAILLLVAFVVACALSTAEPLLSGTDSVTVQSASEARNVGPYPGWGLGSALILLSATSALTTRFAIRSLIEASSTVAERLRYSLATTSRSVGLVYLSLSMLIAGQAVCGAATIYDSARGVAPTVVLGIVQPEFGFGVVMLICGGVVACLALADLVSIAATRLSAASVPAGVAS